MNQPCCPSPSSTWLQPDTAAAVLPGPDAARLHSVQGPGFAQTSQANPNVAVGPGRTASPGLLTVPITALCVCPCFLTFVCPADHIAMIVDGTLDVRRKSALNDPILVTALTTFFGAGTHQFLSFIFDVQAAYDALSGRYVVFGREQREDLIRASVCIPIRS